MIHWLRWLAALGVAVALGVGGCATPAAPSPAPAEDATLYTCPMHPQILQHAPGTCPICGMDLVPAGTTAEAAAAAVTPGVHVDDGFVQRVGVRTTVIHRQTLFKHLRTIGEVTVAEDRVSVVNARVAGWIERLPVDTTGARVSAGEVLATVYSPEAVAVQEELLLATRRGADGASLADAARRKLVLLGFDARDVDAVIADGSVHHALPLRAPRGGYVLDKHVDLGAHIAAGQTLYRLADLDRVWVDASVYERDAPWVSVGQPAEMELAYAKGTVLDGAVDTILPTLNAASRTLQVRLVFDNPDGTLKPGMFATVRIAFRRRDDALAVPTEAIVATGERHVVFVAQGGGRFVPREVTVGIEADHHLTEITGGLDAGEQVVVSGQFLLDSETQLQQAMQDLIAARAGVVAPDPLADTVFSCPMHPEVVQDGPGRCPVCGMFLERRPGTPAELDALHGGHGHPDGHGEP
ncbi:MAG: efflux RND transporter periplasmic adaptor subunit [Alphaproteobacteria bacterium]|nr:efflux RND transporter periplasmic adaptor subunit [Alphaproteobacteria bacterium]